MTCIGTIKNHNICIDDNGMLFTIGIESGSSSEFLEIKLICVESTNTKNNWIKLLYLWKNHTQECVK